MKQKNHENKIYWKLNTIHWTLSVWNELSAKGEPSDRKEDSTQMLSCFCLFVCLFNLFNVGVIICKVYST